MRLPATVSPDAAADQPVGPVPLGQGTDAARGLLPVRLRLQDLHLLLPLHWQEIKIMIT